MADGHWDNTGYPSFSNLSTHWHDQTKSEFSTIGYKRILKFSSQITTSKIRINILDSLRKNPKISNIEVY
jgi:hypothetical protein